MRSLIILAVIVIGIIVIGFWLLSPPERDEITAGASPVEALRGDIEGFYRADGPKEFQFPADHGPHPGYRTEWWYYTGNLFTEDDRHFGYQFTIFRNQLSPPDADPNVAPDAKLNFSQNTDPQAGHFSGTETDPGPPGSQDRSSWATDQLYLAHFAISDINNEEHHYEERFSRGAAGLAGAEADPFRIWLEDWSAERTDDHSPVGEEALPVTIRARNEQMGMDLVLNPVKPIVLHGNQGYDPKGSGPGNASYYLSFTRMQTRGTITIGQTEYDVSGYSWMDHEWSTSVLGEDQEGWDWFSLQLSDGYDLMYYQLRNKDGTLSPYATGTLIDPDGNTIALGDGDVALEEQEHWTSPHTGGTYPVTWRLSIPSQSLNLEIAGYFPDQEMNVSVTYYEGAVNVRGTREDEPVRGYGFVEMTGRISP